MRQNNKIRSKGEKKCKKKKKRKEKRDKKEKKRKRKERNRSTERNQFVVRPLERSFTAEKNHLKSTMYENTTMPRLSIKERYRWKAV